MELTDEEAKQSPSVRALTKDGREATGKLGDDAELIELRFPQPRPAATSNAPTTPPPRPASTRDLAPMPY